MKEKSNPPSFFTNKNSWAQTSNNIWLASTLKLYRNLAKYLFPGKLDTANQQQLLQLMHNATNSLSLITRPTLLKAEELGPTEKQFLFEHFLASESFQQAHAGEGFIIDESGEFFMILNMRDHLQLQLTDYTGEIETVWNRLAKIDTELGKTLNFSYSQRFGFLTGNPFLCGTGLVVRLYLHMPALIHSEQLQPFLEKNKDERILATGMQGDVNDWVGDVVMLHNNITLGISEEDIISSLRNFATKMTVEEKSVRAKLKNEATHALKTKVSRAFGLLLHSYELDTKEAMGALSLCKLGLDLDWLTGIDHLSLNQLFLHSQRAHIAMSNEGKTLSEEEVPIKRATFIRDGLKKAALTI